MSNPKFKQDEKTGRFVPTGEPVMAEKPICVRLPKEIDAAIRAMPNRTKFLRDIITTAVKEQNIAS